MTLCNDSILRILRSFQMQVLCHERTSVDTIIDIAKTIPTPEPELPNGQKLKRTILTPHFSYQSKPYSRRNVDVGVPWSKSGYPKPEELWSILFIRHQRIVRVKEHWNRCFVPVRVFISIGLHVGVFPTVLFYRFDSESGTADAGSGR